MVISMVDVGEQTGALPEMLLKIADNYDEEVDNAVSAMTSLLEPIMIVFLAVVVGSIVIAMFLPLIELMNTSAASPTAKAARMIRPRPFSLELRPPLTITASRPTLQLAPPLLAVLGGLRGDSALPHADAPVVPPLYLRRTSVVPPWSQLRSGTSVR